MNPLDLLPEHLRLALSWLSVVMPLLLVFLHSFRRAADTLYAHALSTPEMWDDEPMRRVRGVVVWLDGWVTALARAVPGPPAPSQFAPVVDERTQS